MTEINYSFQKKPTKRKLIGGIIIAALIVAISFIMLMFYPFGNKDKVDYFKGENPVLLNGEQVGNAIIDKGTVYLPLNIWQEKIDESITFDENSNSVIVTTKDKVIQFPSDSVSYYVNNKNTKLSFHPLRDENGTVYLALDPLASFYPIQYTLVEDDHVVLLEENGQERASGIFTTKKVRKDFTRLRSEAALRSPYTGELAPGEHVTIEKDVDDFYFVRKANGIAGFVKKQYVDKGKSEVVEVELEQKEPKLKKVNGPIQLTWEAVYSRNPDTSKISKMHGVNVVSPTWFKLKGNDGNVSNLGSKAYVNWAHKQDYQVWGLFSNDFDPDKTHEVFKDYQKRQTVIRQLLVYSEMYDLDGINIDIENVREEDGKYITQFVREATPYLHDAGLTVSMDITFIAGGNYSAFLQRDHLAEIVDYLVVMAYDEHWATSPNPGSVASFPWVEANLETLLDIVPNDKLVLGVPLYARLWEEKENGELSSKSLSMESVEEWLKEHKVTPTYDEASGQNYGEYYDKKTKSTFKIWLEDELSLTKRAELVEKYNLAGLASWSRTFANEAAWSALSLEKKEQ
ncbi:family 18 glycosyl hydrolase [Niallia circulans]|jgi:spore germination protein YaaH|uniref:Peptidoglycan hydrolase n=1 Tax=Niallia circulans TaxID=1397 RepID=A0A0J1IQ48_NIACI|nr:glycosyl hydrolase family 18 protein [Niallia circulans]KLV28086.1 peptidoglycan hydrolase [Niallia circulans]MDR4314913.1 peptidoglycan hydrolase [Niallia circulans]MED3837771.1 glycosyl hydrolase family 18 protein [Niallia circulans]MED4243082.1 glycosyl hydrolase family 18 protein [Niallia circulans]MED4247061.1 glycosyl hydrolase family 18 protein [Niallia circulans]